MKRRILTEFGVKNNGSFECLRLNGYYHVHTYVWLGYRLLVMHPRHYVVHPATAMPQVEPLFTF